MISYQQLLIVFSVDRLILRFCKQPLACSSRHHQTVSRLLQHWRQTINDVQINLGVMTGFKTAFLISSFCSEAFRNMKRCTEAFSTSAAAALVSSGSRFRWNAPRTFSVLVLRPVFIIGDLTFALIISRAAATSQRDFLITADIALKIKSGSAKSEVRAGGFEMRGY